MNKNCLGVTVVVNMLKDRLRNKSLGLEKVKYAIFASFSYFFSAPKTSISQINWEI
jgi:hypothetical protein